MKEFSNTIKGMVKDLDILSPDQYAHAYNLILESYDGNSFHPSNDYSNILGFKFEQGEDVVFKKYIVELDKILLLTTKNRILLLSGVFNDRGFNTFNSLDGSVPLEYDNALPILSVKVIAQSGCFNWLIQNKIDLEYKITDSTLNFYIVNGKDEDKFIYFNLKDFTVEESFKEIISFDQYKRPVYSELIDCNALKWNPEISYPTVTTTDTEGGQLPAGVYQYLVAFSTSKGIPLTNYKAATNPYHLFTKTITDVTNYDTGMAMNVYVSNLNEIGRYRFINIAVAKTINGVTTYEQIATLPIASTVSYVHTGNEKAIPLDETVIFQLFPFYKSSEGVTKANNKLFKYGIKEYEKYNLQPLADRFILKWFTTSAKLGSYRSADFAQKYRSNMRDEVIPYAMKFILDNGEETAQITLMGRQANIFDGRPTVFDGDIVNNEKDCNTPAFSLKRRWQVYNTASVTKTDAIVVDECNYKQYQEGELAYWASSDVYPNDPDVWGDNAGKPIRHPKMPDCLVSPHYSNVNGEIIIHPLGVKLDDSVDINAILQEAVSLNLITQEQKDRIRGYKIVRGNRVGNKSVIAKGQLYNTYQYAERERQVLYSNYPFNDLRPDPFLSRDSLKMSPLRDYQEKHYDVEFVENNKYTFQSPDTSYTQPSLGNVLKIEQENYGEAKGTFAKSRGQGEYVILGQPQYNFAIVIAWLLTSRLKLTEAQPGEQGQAIGSGIGAIAGGVVGAFVGGVGAPLGAALGSSLGGIIGKLVGGNTANDDYNDMYRLSMWISQTDRILELLQNTTPLQNYHYQYQAIGRFDKNLPVENNGYKQREIVASAYLNSTRQILPNNTYFNNNDRESSVYLELNNSVGVPTIQDTSRFKMSDKDCDMNEGKELISNISSFYASIKRNILNQYGTVAAIEWLPVSNTMWKLDQNFKEFGGDTFIGGHGLKIKHSYFTSTSFRLPDKTDIYYEDLNNIAYPKFFFNTRYTELAEPQQLNLKILSAIENSFPVILALNNIESPQSVTENIVDWDSNEGVQKAIAKLFKTSVMNPYVTTRPGRYNIDCDVNDFYEKKPDELVQVPASSSWWKNTFGEGDVDKYIPNMLFKFTGVKGKIYTYNYGVNYFITESDVNLDLRHATDPNEGNFYPNISDLDYWLQEENVSPKVDNKYNYNRSYSKQNKEDITLSNDVNFFKEKEKLYYKNRVIYSQEGAETENSSFKDNYLYFKPLDMRDLSLEIGKLISIDPIENQKILVRFENASRVYNAYSTIKADGTTIILGNGSIFDNFQQFSSTDLGYIGSQNKAILNTPFGHIFLDPKRGNVFNLKSGGEGIDELSKDGMRNWFAENLPFKMDKYFDIDIDNSYNGIGISLSYDNRFKRFFITKLDYIPKVKGIEYKDNKFYFNKVEIQLNNPDFFCNASWTISYSFYTQSWSSFHSFLPNYYIDGIDVFYTGLNGVGKGLSSLWIHNATNKSYQTYYGILRPFEIESVTKYNINSQVLTEVGFKLDVIRYHNDNDVSYVEDVSFNKAMVFNERQHSGLLALDIIDKNNLYAYMKYPIKDHNHTRILLFKNESEFNFNQFEDLAIDNNLPRFINFCNGTNKLINLKAINYSKLFVDNNYIRGNKTHIRLINDENNKYRFVYKGLITNNEISTR